ncbi:MAG: hypothetical protein M9949_12950 [Candidatus Kapabacteria bacterium]|nr:hypothetical protein [Candidatus Kapabacteria bacterium]
MKLKYILKILTAICIIILFTMCDDSPFDAPEDEFAIIIAENCTEVNNELFHTGESLNQIQSPPLEEISGIAASINNPGYYWVHNDSGNAPNLFLLDSIGNLVATFRVTSGNRDWEDIACVKNPKDGKSYIYIGDFGDNLAIRPNIKVIEIEEPKVVTFGSLEIIELQHKRDIFFTYPDGAKDAESLIVDPISMDLFIISKRDGFSRVFTSNYPYSDEINELVHVATLPFNTATAADISSDGKEILVRTYIKVYYWQRNGTEHLKYTFQRNPLCLPLIPEPQGEAICFDFRNSGYYTTSEVQGYESLNVTLNYYREK